MSLPHNGAAAYSTWICFQFPRTEFLPSIWHAVLASSHGTNLLEIIVVRWQRRSGFDENDGRWPKATKSSVRKMNIMQTDIVSWGRKEKHWIDSSENKGRGEWMMCQMSQWPSPVCRCLLSDCLHLKQGWHNCHIPVSIRCPPQLKGLRKLGLGWGRKRGDRDKGKCRNSPDILLAYPLVTVLLCLRTTWHIFLWPCSHTCVHLSTPGGHSGKTKATLRGILQQISAAVEKKLEYLDLPLSVTKCCFSSGEMKLSLCGREAQFGN